MLEMKFYYVRNLLRVLKTYNYCQRFLKEKWFFENQKFTFPFKKLLFYLNLQKRRVIIILNYTIVIGEAIKLYSYLTKKI